MTESLLNTLLVALVTLLGADDEAPDAQLRSFTSAGQTTLRALDRGTAVPIANSTAKVIPRFS
jgi:hypothetical protein